MYLTTAWNCSNFWEYIYIPKMFS